MRCPPSLKIAASPTRLMAKRYHEATILLSFPSPPWVPFCSPLVGFPRRVRVDPDSCTFFSPTSIAQQFALIFCFLSYLGGCRSPIMSFWKVPFFCMNREDLFWVSFPPPDFCRFSYARSHVSVSSSSRSGLSPFSPDVKLLRRDMLPNRGVRYSLMGRSALSLPFQDPRHDFHETLSPLLPRLCATSGKAPISPEPF